MPDVIWNCTYPSMDARERIRTLQESDHAFHDIRTRQGTLVQQFMREHYRRLDVM